MSGWIKKALTVIGMTSILAGGASANLLQYSYTGTTGQYTTKASGDLYANPVGKMTFALSAGLDRRVRISIIGGNGRVVASETSHVLGGTDRITVDGKEYYGAFLEVNAPAEGSYQLKAEILSVTGETVSQSVTDMIIDVTPPTFGKLSQINNVTPSFNWNTSTNPWRGAQVGASSNIISVPVNDDTGVQKVTVSSFDEQGQPLAVEIDARYNGSTGVAGYNGIDNDIFKKSGINLLSMTWTATDLAGNQAQISQDVAYSTVSGPSAPWAIQVKDSTNVMAGQVGFEPYRAGMTVNLNPISGIWRVEKKIWNEYAPFGLGVNTGGAGTKVHEDDTWVYVRSTGVVGSSRSFGQWACTHRGECGYRNISVILGEGTPETPNRPTAQYLYSDIGWGNPNRRINSSDLPLSISTARVSVTPRQQTQLVTSGIGSCEVAPGETYCDIPWGITIQPGTAGYMHSCCAVQGIDPSFKEPIPSAVVGISGVRARLKDIPQLITDPVYYTGFWNDLWIPELKDWEQDGDILRAEIFMPANNGFQQKIGFSFAELSIGGTKQRGKQVLSTNSGMNRVYEYSLAGISEGVHPMTMVLENNTGSNNTYQLGDIVFDRTPPKLEIRNIGDSTVASLDQFEVSLSDQLDPNPVITSVRLEGGPATENVQLSSRRVSEGLYALEYPIMFPSLEEGETYTITVTARDAHDNIATDSISFQYSPPVVQLPGDSTGIIHIPAAPVSFNNADGEPAFASAPVKLSDGTLVSGTYDLTATLRVDAPGPLRVDGFLIHPGSTITLNQTDFSQNGGRIILPVHPENQGVEGEYSLLMMSSAPNSSMILANFNAWSPRLNVTKTEDNPTQVLSQQRIAVTTQGSSRCEITTSVPVAKAGDPLRAPVCLFEWDQIPRGMKEVPVAGADKPMTALEGRYLGNGEQKATFNIYLYQPDGTRHSIYQGEVVADVTAVEHSASFLHSLEGTTAMRAVESIDLTLIQTGTAPECVATTDRSEAVRNAATGSALTCFIDFKQVPGDLRQVEVSPPKFKGTMMTADEYPVQWVASIFDADGNEYIMEDKTSVITVVHPPVTTSLSITVNESSSAEGRSTESHPVAWLDKTYSVVTEPENGVVEATMRGFKYTPAPGYLGADSFTYRVTDTSGMFAEAEAEVTVVKFNYPPTVDDVTVEAPRNQPSEYPLAASDKNLWDEHTFEIVNGPSPAGIKAKVVDGKLVVEPVEHWYGTTKITYRATDLEKAKSEPATITVNIPLAEDSVDPTIRFVDPSACLAPGSVKDFSFELEDFDSGIDEAQTRIEARFSDVTLDVPIKNTNASQVKNDRNLEVAPRRYVVSPAIKVDSELDQRLRAAFYETEANGGRMPFDLVVTTVDVAGNSSSAAFTLDPSQIDDVTPPEISISLGGDGNVLKHASELVVLLRDDRAGIHYEEVYANLSYEGESIPIVFSQAYSQGSSSSEACYARHPLRVELRSYQSTMMEPDALSMLSRAYMEDKELTLTVSASDYAGNVSSDELVFNFKPDIYVAEEVSVPAVKYQFRDAKGDPTVTLSTDNLTWGHTDAISYIAVASKEGGAPLAVNNQSLANGIPVPVAGVVGSSELTLDIRADETGLGGKAEVMLIPLQSNARTVVIPVHVWVPDVELKMSQSSPVQLFDEVVISPLQRDSMACSLSANTDRARNSQKMESPVCLFNWEILPEGLYAPSGDAAQLTGRMAQPGEYVVAWSATLFDDDGNPHMIKEGEKSFVVRHASDMLRFGIENNPREIYRVISNVHGSLRQTSGPRCSLLSLSEELVYDMSARNMPACHISWEEVPEGIVLDEWSSEPKFSGSYDLPEGDGLFKWVVSSFTPGGEKIELGVMEEVVTLLEPPSPAIDMDVSHLIGDDLYEVALSGGVVGEYTVQSLNSPLKIQVSEDGTVIEEKEIAEGLTSRLTHRGRVLAGDKPLWTKTLFGIGAHYIEMPNVSSKKEIEVLSVPDKELRPRIDLVSGEVINTEGMTVVGSMGYPYGDAPYSAEGMGEWELRLLNYHSTSSQDALTDYARVDQAGQVTFDIDLLGLGYDFIRVMPQARLISPLPEYQRVVLGSRPLHVTVLRGEAIDSSVEARRVVGEAPLRFMAKLDLENRLDYRALGDVVWEIRSNGSGDWEPAESGSSIVDRYQGVFEKGKYQLRAKVINKNSGAEFITEHVDIHAYNIPRITIDGPSNAFIGSDATLKLSATADDGTVSEEDLLIEWSEDNGDTWVSGGMEHVISRDGQERVMVMVKARMADSPDDWSDAYASRRHRVAFRPVGPPRGSILGARVIEEGKPVQWRGSARAPYPRMDVEIEGRFILPDGRIVEEDEIEYIPTREDIERDRNEITYESWIVGFEDQGAQGSVSRRVTVWEYRWPDWSMNVRASATQAPAEVNLRVRKPVGMGRYLEEVKYEWELPENVELVAARTEDSRILQIEEPGYYPVQVTITDARGNETVLIEEIHISPPDEWEVDFRMSMSNPDSRAPLDIRLSPVVRGGHPRDRIAEYRYLLDGEPVSEGLRYSSVELDAGSYELALEITTDFGEVVRSSKEVEVKENTPPVCELEAQESRSHMRFFAHCTDETGRVRRHIWTANGEQLTLSGSRISVSSRDGGVVEVQLTAIDDGGAESEVVSWHGSILTPLE